MANPVVVAEVAVPGEVRQMEAVERLLAAPVAVEDPEAAPVERVQVVVVQVAPSASL
jgi:hypothetical protein